MTTPITLRDEEALAGLWRSESSFVQDYRRRMFEKLQHVRPPQFRHGISILIEPQFDYSTIVPSAIENPFEIHHADQLKIHHTLPEEAHVFLDEKWMTTQDQLSYFHEAGTNAVLFIDIPAGVVLERPVEIHLTGKKTTVASIFVRAGKQSQVQFAITRSSDVPVYMSSIVRVLAEDDSTVDVMTIQNMHKESMFVQDHHARTGRNATVNWVEVVLGSQYTRAEVQNSLVSQGANGTITVLYMGSGDQRLDLYTASLHHAPNTTSDIVTKGVSNHTSKALSRGLVRIGEQAFESQGYEKQDALILSSQAEADAIPNLEIHNHDVKCSHGSTIGQVDEEQLFYLMSRGMDRATAIQQIVEGYFADVLLKIRNPVLHDQIQKRIREGLACT